MSEAEIREPRFAGDVVWHSYDEDGPDCGQHIGLPGGASLWIGEIAKAEWNDFDEDEQALGGDGGWWIILYTADKAKYVLGRAPAYPTSSDAIEALAACFLTGPPPRSAPMWS